MGVLDGKAALVTGGSCRITVNAVSLDARGLTGQNLLAGGGLLI